MPQLAGISVSEELTLALAGLLNDAGHEDVADALVTALEQERPIVALTTLDREAIISVLDDPPDGLAELGAVLRSERGRREREGL
jgi:hypothetical protein